jgi:hypothetical protein
MYYLRTLGATQIEKSTLDAKKFGFTQKRTYTGINESIEPMQEGPSTQEDAVLPSTTPISINAARSCSLTNPDCDACQ